MSLGQIKMSCLAEESAAASPAIDPETRRALRAFLDRIAPLYSVQHALLFGSRARRTYRHDSDADLAVVLKGERGDRYQVAGDMAGIAFDVLMETGVLVDPTPFWEDEWNRPERFTNPFLIATIKREGVLLS